MSGTVMEYRVRLALLLVALLPAACRRHAASDATVRADATAAVASGPTYAGTMQVVAVDPRPGTSATGSMRYTLLREGLDGDALTLEIPDGVLRNAGGASVVAGKSVVLRGTLSADGRTLRVTSLSLGAPLSTP